MTQITKGKLREAIRRVVEAKLIGEVNLPHFSAMRLLKLEAQKTVLKFEEQMVKELGLIHPDQMDEVSQQVYYQTMEELHKKISASVVDAIRAMGSLPKQPENDNAPANDNDNNMQPRPAAA